MPRRRVLALALAALLIPSLALAREGRRPSPGEILHSPKLLAKFLNLSDAQVTQEQALFKTLGDTLKGLHDQEKTAREQLAAALGGRNPNACDVGALVIQIDGLHDQAKAALQKFDTDFSAILTPDQLAKYQALKQAAHFGDDDD
jgi:Spy/CpxP family protein refolding chaperone